MNPCAYVLLAAGEGHRADLVAYLIRWGLNPNSDTVHIIVASAHKAAVEKAMDQSQIPATFTELGEEFSLPPSNTTHIFILPDGSEDPRKCLLPLRPWLEDNQIELNRIATLVDCAWAEQSEDNLQWFDFLIHFSDSVLLTNRNTVSKKWIQAYLDRFKKQAIPSRIEYLKKDGHIDNPTLFLEPEARRLTLYFDPEENDEPLPTHFQIEGLEDDPEDEAIDPRDPQNDPYLAYESPHKFKFPFHPPDNETD